MAPSACTDLHPAEGEKLLEIARGSIASGLRHGRALEVAAEALCGTLAAPRGVFVTLTRREALRGCIGSMESSEPLARGVADSAFGAAFRDPRFPALQHHEFTDTHIEISILSPMEPLPAESREALLAALAPGIDGLLLEEGRHRSTFLPKVWDQLPDPEQFLGHLLAKAGLPSDYWSSGLRFRRYTTTSVAEERDPGPPGIHP